MRVSGTVYGIRPHVYRSNEESEFAKALALEHRINRESIELWLDFCIGCQTKELINCTCHERGSN